MTHLVQQDGVYVLDLGADENRFTLDWLKQVDAHLDEVVASPAPLVTTAGGKFYSNGLDLEYVLGNPEQLSAYVAEVQALFARVLELPVPTVAAVPGHAFGAGAMLAMAHDWRVMRSERGYFCFPEVDINIPFTPGMAALIQAKLTPQGAIVAMSTGQRYDAGAAVAAGLVDSAAAEADVLPSAIARVQPLAGKDPGTLGAIKATMFAGVLRELRTPEVHGA
ncbi:MULTISPECIES: enoyl-CoA hydratase-related protein [unclassified Nocardioides]|uniref:enoyl-CoA hydratase-related protein n=1 Tax=unclassified Nocardioides TaxID=2615069 RepID=UPI0006FA3A18|nr:MULTISPECIES: enoyl-CoA hydratase-related protein [unclassified Nocardioides]KRA37710.1 enoyl-CoA hydratase [Nocardioides sp. Root614]KRA91670.1 enoyl-CoA hydratase [Nocardioides sp. Root682]